MTRNLTLGAEHVRIATKGLRIILRLRYDASLITDKQVYVKEQHMGAVEQTSETDDILPEDVIDSQVSSRERT